ncbi:hypothetical protein H0H93_003744, partial [Arthromyces matolae]
MSRTVVKKPVILDSVTSSANTLVNVRCLKLSLAMIPNHAFLKSIMSLKHLEAVHFNPIRLDGPSIEGLFAGIQLSTLVVTVNGGRLKEINLIEEKANIQTLLRDMAPSL